MTENKPIIIVGAGVVGLSSALVLAEKGYEVTIVAKHLPDDPLTWEYTSPWAGAHFRPFPSKSRDDERSMKMTRVTQEHFKKLAKSNPESSIRFLEGVEYFEAPDKYYQEIGYGYKEQIDNFQVLDQRSLPEGTVLGTKYTTWVLNSPHYLRYLQSKLAFQYGVKFHKMDVKSLKNVFDEFQPRVIINCSGRGIQYDGNFDPKSFTIRGQTLLVRAPPQCPYLNKTITHQSKDNSWTFVIPRPLNGGVILGGTKQIGDTRTSPRPDDTEALISRGRKLFPELFIDGQLDIRFINVGFRPAREGGPRVELENISSGTIIHAYGAGGMGYELSHGMALEVLKLFESIPIKANL